MKRILPIFAFLASTACASGALVPATLDTVHETCASCRMVVSDRRLAAQIVAPGEDPRFFDDLGCLREYVRAHQSVDAAIFVADHRTGEWTPVSSAVFSRLARPTTPMASGLVAHATMSSRDADPSAASSSVVPVSEAVGPSAHGGQP